jgi:capsular polysaccharide biosynthesis protein
MIKYVDLQDENLPQKYGIFSKIRHFQSLRISLTVLRLVTQEWNKHKLLSLFYKLFSSSNDAEVTEIFAILSMSSRKNQMFSLKNSLFIGMILKVNLHDQCGLTLLERIYLNFLLRKLPIQHLLINSRINDISTSSHGFLNKRLLEAKSYFERTHVAYALPFRKLEIIDSNCLATDRGVVFDRKGRAYFNDPSIKREIVSNAGLHDVLVRFDRSKDLAYFAKKNVKHGRMYPGNHIYLASRCSSNYWHFLIEDAVRLLDFKCDNPNLHIDGIAVSGDVVKVGREIISYIYPEVSILSIPNDRYIQFERAYAPNSHLILDDQPTYGVSKTFNYSLSRIERLRNKFLEMEDIGTKLFGSKIYIRRNSGHRLIEGETELIKKLIEKDFNILDLSEFTFLEQVRIFNNAKMIIGLAGAAWANIVFCSKSSRVLSLVGEDAAPWDMHGIVARDLNLSYTQYVVQHSETTDFFYTNYLHRDIALSERNINEILKWVGDQ